MKLNIQITLKETGIFKTEEKIVEIDICNGNWKYWDRYSEDDTKKTLTLNNIHNAHVIHYPVKDAIPSHDIEAWKQDHEIIVNGASVRRYDNLLSYLQCRVDNAKDSYKKHGWTEHYYAAVLFEMESYFTREDTVTKDITYEAEGLIEIKITVVE